MKLQLLLVSTLPDRDQGGVELLIRDLHNQFKHHGVQSTLVTKSNKYNQLNSDHLTSPMTDVVTRFKIPTASTLIGFTRSAWFAFYILINKRPDIVHIHYLDFGIIYWSVFKKLFGYKLVITGHGDEVTSLLNNPNSLRAKLLPKLLFLADELTSVADKICTQLTQLTDKKPIACIPNAVDHVFWRNGNRKQRKCLEIISVGRLSHIKGYDILITSLAHIVDEVDNVKCTIIGNGNELKHLKSLARNLGVLNYINFTGKLNRQQIRQLLYQATIYVQPSRAEGMPLALMEAYASGLPIISSDVGGISELIHHQKNGLLVAPCNTEQLAKEMIRLLKSPNLREQLCDKQNQGNLIYSFDDMLEKYLSLYKKISSNP